MEFHVVLLVMFAVQWTYSIRSNHCSPKKLWKIFPRSKADMLSERCKAYIHHVQDSLAAKKGSEDAQSLFKGLPVSRVQQRRYPGLRREYRQLSTYQRWRFHRAVQHLHRRGIYEKFVRYHQFDMALFAHFGPSFLPWHREFLNRFETALRKIDPTVSIPYFDSTLDEGLPDSTHSIMWTKEFLGNGDGPVTSGPFANFTVPDFAAEFLGHRLVRNIGENSFGSLASNQDVKRLLNGTHFRDLVWTNNPFIEGVHNLVHVWIGGHMNDLNSAPADPVFFMHHSMVDCWFQEFRYKQIRNNIDVETDYITDPIELGDPGYAFDAPMRPFKNVKNGDGLKRTYRRNYRCAPRPKCSKRRPYCRGFLFCDTRSASKYRCLSQIRPGGNCKDFEKLLRVCTLGHACIKGMCRRF